MGRRQRGRRQRETKGTGINSFSQRQRGQASTPSADLQSKHFVPVPNLILPVPKLILADLQSNHFVPVPNLLLCACPKFIVPNLLPVPDCPPDCPGYQLESPFPATSQRSPNPASRRADFDLLNRAAISFGLPHHGKAATFLLALIKHRPLRNVLHQVHAYL